MAKTDTIPDVMQCANERAEPTDPGVMLAVGSNLSCSGLEGTPEATMIQRLPVPLT